MSFIPPHIFSKEWREGNFLMPTEQIIRAELRQKFFYYLHLGEMTFPEHRETKRILMARLAAIDALDAVLLASKIMK